MSRCHPEAIKLVHALPSLFLLFLISIGVNLVFLKFMLIPQLLIFWVWALLVINQAYWKYGSLLVGHLALLTSLAQLCGYGAGLLVELAIKLRIG